MHTVPGQTMTRHVQVRVQTSTTPLALILMLFDGVVDYLHKAHASMESGNTSRKAHYISRSMAIIEDLLGSLNLEVGGEMVVQLHDLYLYILRELTFADAGNDIVKLRNVERLVRDLRTAWRRVC